MKVKINPPTSKLFGVINWKELGKQLWEMCRALARVGREATAKPPARAHAVKPVLLAATAAWPRRSSQQSAKL